MVRQCCATLIWTDSFSKQQYNKPEHLRRCTEAAAAWTPCRSAKDIDDSREIVIERRSETDSPDELLYVDHIFMTLQAALDGRAAIKDLSLLIPYSTLFPEYRNLEICHEVFNQKLCDSEGFFRDSEDLAIDWSHPVTIARAKRVAAAVTDRLRRRLVSQATGVPNPKLVAAKQMWGNSDEYGMNDGEWAGAPKPGSWKQPGILDSGYGNQRSWADRFDGENVKRQRVTGDRDGPSREQIEAYLRKRGEVMHTFKSQDDNMSECSFSFDKSVSAPDEALDEMSGAFFSRVQEFAKRGKAYPDIHAIEIPGDKEALVDIANIVLDATNEPVPDPVIKRNGKIISAEQLQKEEEEKERKEKEAEIAKAKAAKEREEAQERERKDKEDAKQRLVDEAAAAGAAIAGARSPSPAVDAD